MTTTWTPSIPFSFDDFTVADAPHGATCRWCACATRNAKYDVPAVKRVTFDVTGSVTDFCKRHSTRRFLDLRMRDIWNAEVD